MDIKIERSKWSILKKYRFYIFILLFVLLLVVVIVRNGGSTLRVEAKYATIEEVAEDEFNDYIRLSGQVQPITSVQITPLEGGVVEQIMVEEGASVKRGDLLAVLSSDQLDLTILNSETALAEKRSELRNAEVEMEQKRLNLKQERLELELDVKRKYRAYIQQESLYESKLAAKEDWIIAKEDYELALNSRELSLERQKQDSIYRVAQVEQLQASLESMRKSLALAKRRVDNLRIRSPIDGEVGLLDIVLGESISSGESAGQVNDLSAFKIETNINEHYIDKVSAGLIAHFERQDTTYQTTLRRVYPEVRDEEFRAEFKFLSDPPKNIRSGQTYYLNLQLSEPREVLLIPRGAFYQSTGGGWIFVVDESGKRAERREIVIGRQNPQFYEVVEGLKAGERVITSSYDKYGDKKVLILE
ncbi:MAG: efflux RND transporter periplasmic adaptor subunit [Rikenellaceae bacterium]